MLMLRSYADESGSDKFLVLAGYVLPFDFWIPFIEDWQKVLDDKRLPIQYFHMVEAESGNGEFLGVPEEFRKMKVRDFLTVIEKHEPIGLCSHIKLSDWEELALPFARNGYKDAYYPLFSSITHLIFSLNMIERVQTPVEFVFDEQTKVKKNAIDMYDRTKKIYEPALELHRLFGDTPQFRDDKLVLPLQAADMLAWHKRRTLDFPNEERDDIGERLERTILLKENLDRPYLLGLLDGRTTSSASPDSSE